ncbi:Uma2 family endonuclease [soil metagenome]
MGALPLHHYTFAEYTRLEAESSTRHEFLDGEIYAMAGGTPEHAAMAMAIGSPLLERLRGGPCRVFTSDLRVRVSATGLTTYPDVTVVCGPSLRDPDSPTTVTNPKVVVEVTSDGTERYDRGEKLEHYQRVPTIDAVVIVSHRERCIEVWTRDETGWVHAIAREGERAMITPIGCWIDVDAIYAAAAEPT